MAVEVKVNEMATEEFRVMDEKPVDSHTDSYSIDDISCGIQLTSSGKRCRISFLQKFATPRWALAFMAVAYIFSDGVVNGVFHVTLTTVEKRFQLRTTESGIIGVMIDVGACVGLIAAGFFGENLHKAQWMGRGVFVSGIGCFIFLLPHFIIPEYTVGEKVKNYCGNVTEVECSNSPIRNYRYIFMLGMFFCGIGSENVGVLGTTFLDENVKQVYSALYNGIYAALGAFGPAFGYLLGGLTLELFTIPNKSIPIDTSSSLWVGAWWIGYIAAGIGLLIFSLPVMLLPKYLPNTDDVRKNREQRQDKSTNKKDDIRLGRRLLALATNKMFICITIATMVHQALIFGFMTYSIKLGVELLGLPETTSAYYLGALAIATTVIGYVIGGLVVTKFQLKLRGILQFILACSIVSFAFVFGLYMQCTEKEFVGATVIPHKQNSSTVEMSILTSCNSGCQCNTDRFNPVCDDNGVTYFSPCHAGCMDQTNETHFVNCRCLNDFNLADVSADKCPHNSCTNLNAILIIVGVSFLAGYLTVIPGEQATIRSVRFDERTLAFSIQKVTHIIFGRLLGRLLFAQALDSACLVSSTECGETGTCRAYLRRHMSRNVTMLMAAEKFVGVVFIAITVILVRMRKEQSLKLEDSVANEQNSELPRAGDFQ
ncbi:solute carrier organic anion transporter family member 4A1-like isoform X1 [Styela clava]